MSAANQIEFTPCAKRCFKRRRLTVLSRLAEGGIAELFVATDPDDRKVVLRALKPRFSWSWRTRRCFRRGVELRRRLGSHPHIVQYLGEGCGLEAFEVIEFVPGSTLKELIVRRDSVPKLYPMEILMQVAEALRHVHQAGVLHLDVKPENILVISDGESVRVKLTDFDLCQPIDRKQAPRNFGGSLAYLPPEYLARKEISISTDLFAFGVLAYNLFTFQMPFVGSVATNMRGGTYDVKFPTTPEGQVHEAAIKFIRRCLAPEVMHRFCDDNELQIGLRVLQREIGHGGPRLTDRLSRG